MGKATPCFCHQTFPDCCQVFPAVMDCIPLEPYSKTSKFEPKVDFVRVLYPSNDKVTKTGPGFNNGQLASSGGLMTLTNLLPNALPFKIFALACPHGFKPFRLLWLQSGAPPLHPTATSLNNICLFFFF